MHAVKFASFSLSTKLFRVVCQSCNYFCHLPPHWSGTARGSTCRWESYPHDSQGVSKAKLKQRLTDLTKEALPSSFLIEAFWVSVFISGTFIWCSSLWLSRIPCSATCVTTTSLPPLTWLGFSQISLAPSRLVYGGRFPSLETFPEGVLHRAPLKWNCPRFHLPLRIVPSWFSGSI